MALAKAHRMRPVVYSAGALVIRISPVEIRVDATKGNSAAIIIPKKCVALSTKRNKAKRQCASILSKGFKSRQIGAIIVKVFRRPATGESIPEALGECLEKLGK